MVFAVLIGVNVYFFFLRGGHVAARAHEDDGAGQVEFVGISAARAGGAAAPSRGQGRGRTIRRPRRRASSKARWPTATPSSAAGRRRPVASDGERRSRRRSARCSTCAPCAPATATRCASTPRITCAPSSIASRRRSPITSCATRRPRPGRRPATKSRSRRATPRSAASSVRRCTRRSSAPASRPRWSAGSSTRSRGTSTSTSTPTPATASSIIVEKKFLGGKFYKYGRVLAAEYKGRTGTFAPSGSSRATARPAGYYTEHGESIVKSLLKTPLKYVRVSSTFDRHRFHPDPAHREGAPRRRLRGAAGHPGVGDGGGARVVRRAARRRRQRHHHRPLGRYVVDLHAPVAVRQGARRGAARCGRSRSSATSA